MLELTEHFAEILIVIAMLGLGCVVYLQWHELSRLRRMIRRERSDREQLESDLHALLACSRTIGERVQSHDTQQTSILKKLEAMDQQRDAGFHPAYQQIRKMLDTGVGIEDVARIYDLGTSEIDLLSRLKVHRNAA